MSQQQVGARIGASKVGLQLKNLMRSKAAVSGDAVYLEVLEHDGSAYIVRRYWGTIHVNPVTTAGFFLVPDVNCSGNWQLISFESVQNFKLFSLTASSYEGEEL